MLEKAWRAARLAVGRPDLHFHDLRHSGLTWAAATGASTKELMVRDGHSTAAVALRYQHATANRDRTLADALAELARPAVVTPRDGPPGRRDPGVTHTAVTGGQSLGPKIPADLRLPWCGPRARRQGRWSRQLVRR